ncbi:MAG: diguanylate cyclase [Oscillospiraceae bacterium]|nr:diguanylate cyclase [Oscillospiraceae bacterium]
MQINEKTLKMMSLVFDISDKGMVLFDESGSLIYYNLKAVNLLGREKLRDGISRKEFLSANRIVNDGHSRDNFSVQYTAEREGKPVPLRCDYKMLSNQQGGIIGDIFMFSDIALETDILTGFHNWESFKLFANRNPAQFKPPIAVAILDINSLAMINSSFGRNVGDRLIRELSGAMKKHFPEGTYFVREHEAHLVAICRNTTEPAMKETVEKIRNDFSGNIQYALNTTSCQNDNLVSAIREASKGMKTKKLLDLNSSHSELIATLVKALEECDNDTKEHVQRTMTLGEKLGKRLGFSDIQLSNLSLLCMLHDIGKIGVPLEILNKPARLNEDEWAIMRAHTEKGYQIASSAKELENIADMVLHHHERWDGMGYPDGLSKESIPVLSRTISVIDSFDAMVNDRVYRKAMTVADALEELRKCAGSQFDPHIVSEFILMMKEEPGAEKTESDTVSSGYNDNVPAVTSNNINPVFFSRYVLDEENRIIQVDDTFEKFTGYSRSEIEKNKIYQMDLIPKNDLQEYLCAVEEQLQKSTLAFFEHYLKKKNGDIVLVLCLGEVYTDSLTGKLRSNITISNIMHTRAVKTMIRSEQEKAQKRLRQWETQYRSDPLTGLMNHSAFESDVETRLLSGTEKVMMIMIDFDNFKEYNDTYGHKKGDEFLIIAGRSLSSLVREGDLACRMGGDEFALAMFFSRDIPESKLYTRAERIFNELSVAMGSSIENFSGVSMGAAVSTPDISTFNRLYESADRMLYLSKERGRNQITCFSDDLFDR